MHRIEFKKEKMKKVCAVLLAPGATRRHRDRFRSLTGDLGWLNRFVGYSDEVLDIHSVEDSVEDMREYLRHIQLSNWNLFLNPSSREAYNIDLHLVVAVP